MKYILPALTFLVITAPVFAEEVSKRESTVKSYDDYVKIRFMPSRSGFLKKQPVTEFISKSHTIVVKKTGEVMGTNETIKQIYQKAKILSDKGITSNQRFFHVAFKKIEVSYMGTKVSLDYVGKSGVDKYAQYEKDWLGLYDIVYKYLSRNIDGQQ